MAPKEPAVVLTNQQVVHLRALAPVSIETNYSQDAVLTANQFESLLAHPEIAAKLKCPDPVCNAIGALEKNVTGQGVRRLCCKHNGRSGKGASWKAYAASLFAVVQKLGIRYPANLGGPPLGNTGPALLALDSNSSFVPPQSAAEPLSEDIVVYNTPEPVTIAGMELSLNETLGQPGPDPDDMDPFIIPNTDMDLTMSEPLSGIPSTELSLLQRELRLQRHEQNSLVERIVGQLGKMNEDMLSYKSEMAYYRNQMMSQQKLITEMHARLDDFMDAPTQPRRLTQSGTPNYPGTTSVSRDTTPSGASDCTTTDNDDESWKQQKRSKRRMGSRSPQQEVLPVPICLSNRFDGLETFENPARRPSYADVLLNQPVPQRPPRRPFSGYDTSHARHDSDEDTDVLEYVNAGDVLVVQADPMQRAKRKAIIREQRLKRLQNDLTSIYCQGVEETNAKSMISTLTDLGLKRGLIVDVCKMAPYTYELVVPKAVTAALKAFLERDLPCWRVLEDFDPSTPPSGRAPSRTQEDTFAAAVRKHALNEFHSERIKTNPRLHAYRVQQRVSRGDRFARAVEDTLKFIEENPREYFPSLSRRWGAQRPSGQEGRTNVTQGGIRRRVQTSNRPDVSPTQILQRPSSPSAQAGGGDASESEDVEADVTITPNEPSEVPDSQIELDANATPILNVPADVNADDRRHV